MSQHTPIIVVKKVEGHGGSHGAWKVAYADFVTAMMALFIVLWLLNTSKQIQEAVGGYFKDPTGTSKKVGNGKTGAGDFFTATKENMNLKTAVDSRQSRQVRDLSGFPTAAQFTQWVTNAIAATTCD